MHLFDNIRRTHLGNGLAALVAVLFPDTRIQESQIVVNLRNCPDRRAWIFRGGFLIDCNGRRQSFDLVHIRLADTVEELSGIGGERLDIAALPFGVEGIERQRTLAAAADTGDDYKGVFGYFKVDIFQIVFTRTENFDLIHPNLSAVY